MAVNEPPRKTARSDYFVTSEVGVVGGVCVVLTATVALPIRTAVMVDLANDNAVVVATQAAPFLYTGIVVGKVDSVGNVLVGVAAAAADKVCVQVTGVAEAIAEGAVANGDIVKVSATAGAVETDASPTFAEGVVGVALDTATDGNPVRVKLW